MGANTRQRMRRLGNDGSLDTIIVCSDCGWEMRYHYDPYSDFVDWCLDDAEGEHECPAIVDHYDGDSRALLVSFPVECAIDCIVPGQPADEAITHWLSDARVFWYTDDAALRRALKGYGAWEDLDTADTDTLRSRVLWLAAGDWHEEQLHRQHR
jgi:hypothetical protein